MRRRRRSSLQDGRHSARSHPMKSLALCWLRIKSHRSSGVRGIRGQSILQARLDTRRMTARLQQPRRTPHAHYTPEKVEHTTSIFVGECVPKWHDGVPGTSGTPFLGGGAKVFSNWTVRDCSFEPPHDRTSLHAISLDGIAFSGNTIAGGANEPFVLVGSAAAPLRRIRARGMGMGRTDAQMWHQRTAPQQYRKTRWTLRRPWAHRCSSM